MLRAHTWGSRGACWSWLVVAIVGLGGALPRARAEEPLTRLEPGPVPGTSAAVIVDDQTLICLSQLLPIGADRRPVADSATAQAEFLFSQLRAALSGTANQRMVKLNLMTDSDQSAAAAAAELARWVDFTGGPVLTVATGRSLLPGIRVSLDAIVAEPDSKNTRLSDRDYAALRPLVAAPKAVVARRVASGPLLFVSGQAEPGATIAEATRQTMLSLQRTLEWQNLTFDDVVAIRSFLSPLDQAGVAAGVIGEFSNAPQTLLEWNSPGTIEIELIAALNRPVPAGVEYLTPPGMTQSPLYSRAAAIQGRKLIFVSGLLGPPAADATGQVTGIFTRLEELLARAGGNLRHLVKATYFVSTDAASQKLNELRPRYYDPARPPAASKAPVSGVGFLGRQLTIDIIAVPAP